jgi:hypothetical protein
VRIRIVPAALCALGAHALLYGTFRPTDGLHAYFGWYEPGVALAGIAVALLARPVWLRSTAPVGETSRRLATTAIFILLAQESLERSLTSGHPAFAALTPSALLVALFGVSLTALAFALVLRAGQAVARLVLRARVAGRRVAPPSWSVVAFVPGPVRPLAERFALRAPPPAVV